MSDKALKPCPFCGSKAKLYQSDSGYETHPTTIKNGFRVKCSNDYCGFCSKVYWSRIFQRQDGSVEISATGVDEAVEAWNRREAEPIHCKDCANWIEQYFCKTVHHPTKPDDTCETAFGARRRQP